MPTNKNALTRYKYLDQFLSDKHHCYSMSDLTDMCNEKLAEAGVPTVTVRCIQKDILNLQLEPFFADIEEYRFNNKNRCYRYAKPSFSIFKKELSDEERILLREVLNTIGQFDGLTNFEWLDSLKSSLGVEDSRKIISFSHNPYLKNSNMLGVLFDYISNKVTVELTYHTFSDLESKKTDLFPYLLKQYNSRWFLFGAAVNDKKILTFALDRIDEVKPRHEIVYEDCPNDIMERFEDIVGVTYYEDRPIEHIVFWVSDKSKDYVITKPIHESQTQYKNEKEEELRSKYNQLEGGSFFSIDCIPNYELIQVLTSYGAELIVLSPENVSLTIFNRIYEQFEKYKTMRT